MLTTNQLRQTAARSGARDITNVEIDVILTHLLQLLNEHGLMEHLAFKGGTMLRKMVFGPRGRLSTDLDFTCRTNIHVDDLMLMLLESLGRPYHGIDFRFDKDKDWYLTADGCAANPVCLHADNERGIKVKLQVSTRERPILPVMPSPQVSQHYFRTVDVSPCCDPLLAIRGGCRREDPRREPAFQDPRLARPVRDLDTAIESGADTVFSCAEALE